MTARRFPPPRIVDELEACFVVKDSAGQKLAYVFYEKEPGRSLAPGRHALRTQPGFTRSNDAGGEINGSDSGARDASGCDSGAVHPIKLATTRTPMQTIFTNTLLTVASVAAWV
jgi:hypothetical protein